MTKLSTITLAAALTLFAVSGCKKNSQHAEGPAESAGEEVDQATERAGDEAEEAGDRVDESVEETGDRVEDATD